MLWVCQIAPSQKRYQNNNSHLLVKETILIVDFDVAKLSVSLFSLFLCPSFHSLIKGHLLKLEMLYFFVCVAPPKVIIH